MHSRLCSITILCVLTLFFGATIPLVLAQELKSKPVTTEVGNPTASSSEASSCPLQSPHQAIRCGSFMTDPKYASGCNGPQPIDRGHIGRSYGGYKGSIEATSASRRAHSIDVPAPAGTKVFLPTINGESVTWNYAPNKSYDVTLADGGGYGHVFVASVGSDRWVLHLLHTDHALTPPPSGGSYKSGDQVTTVAATKYTHVHINIGKSPEGDNSGKGWLNPEDLGMCTD